jgi:hypothetical protein
MLLINHPSGGDHKTRKLLNHCRAADLRFMRGARGVFNCRFGAWGCFFSNQPPDTAFENGTTEFGKQAKWRMGHWDFSGKRDSGTQE